MADLKLPEIRPVGPISSAAGDIERAGAQFNQAMQGLGEVDLQRLKARALTQSHEALLKKAQFDADFQKTLDENPIFNTETVRQMFDGNVPPDVEGFISTRVGDQTLTRNDIRFHEIAPQLYARRSPVAIQAATAGIEMPKARVQAQQAMAVDDVKAAEAIHAKTVGLEHAVLSVRLGAIYDASVAARRWDQAGLVVDAVPDAKVQAQLRAQLPLDRRNAEISDSLKPVGATYDEQKAGLMQARAAIEANQFIVPLNDKEQHAFLSAADAKIADITKAQYTAKVNGFAAPLIQIRNLPPAQRRQAAIDSMWFLPVDHGLTEEDASKLQSLHDKLLNGEEVKDNLAMLAWLRESGDARLRSMSRGQVEAVLPNFSDATGKQIIDIWSKIQEGKNPVASDFYSPEFMKLALQGLNRVLGTNKYDDTKSFAQQPEDALQEVQRLLPALTAWRRANPDGVLTKSLVDSWAAGLQGLRSPGTSGAVMKETDPGWFSSADKVKTPLLQALNNLGYDNSNRTFRDHAQKIFVEEKPYVDAAWQAVGETTEMPADLRVQVHALIAPVVSSGRLITNPNLKRIDAEILQTRRPEDQGKPITWKERVTRILYNMEEATPGARARANAEAERLAAVLAIAAAADAKRAEAKAAETNIPLQQMEAIQKQEREAATRPVDYTTDPAYKAELAAAQEQDYAEHKYNRTRAVLAKWKAEGMKPAVPSEALAKKQAEEAAAYRAYLKSKGVSEKGGNWPAGVLGFTEWRAQR